jgi:hypothetical protein
MYPQYNNMLIKRKERKRKEKEKIYAELFWLETWKGV